MRDRTRAIFPSGFHLQRAAIPDESTGVLAQNLSLRIELHLNSQSTPTSSAHFFSILSYVIIISLKIFTRSSHFYSLFHFIWINLVVLLYSFWIESLTLEYLRKAIGSILYYLDDSISCSMTPFSKKRSIVRASGYLGAIMIIISSISHFGLNSFLILLCFLQAIFSLNKIHFFINF